MRDDLPSIGLSTVWNLESRGSMDQAVRELLESGFGLIEVMAPRGARDLEAAAARLRQARGRCASVAFPVVSPETMPDETVDLAADDRVGQRRAEAILRETIRVATDFRSGALVLKGPRVPVPRASGRLQLLDEALQGTDTETTDKLRSELLADREAGRDAVLDRFCRSLHDLLRDHPGLRVALAPSADLLTTPNARELEWLFDELGESGRLGYWHASGVCAIRETLGLDRASDWLGAPASRLMGAHLSDAQGLEAGLLPGLGTVDWTAVREILSPTLPRILRLAPGTEMAMIREAIRWLETGS